MSCLGERAIDERFPTRGRIRRRGSCQGPTPTTWLFGRKPKTASSRALARSIASGRGLGPSVKWLRRGIGAAAIGYPITLIALSFALRFIGERWWITGVAIYLPRIMFGLPLPIIVLALALTGQRKLLWTQVVAALAIVFPLMGLSFKWPWWGRRDPQLPVLRILSYNINSGHGEGVFDDIVAEIDRNSPDIVFLQETGFPDKIASLLEERYPQVNFSDRFLVASRYHVLASYEPPKLEYGYDGRLHSARFIRLVLDTPLGRLACYDIHPVSPREALYRAKSQGKRGLLTGRVFSAAYVSTFYGNSGLRELQIRAFTEEAKRETESVLIAGDTNLPDLSFVLNRYLGSFQDAFVEAGWGFGYTFPTNKFAPWMRLDRIFASDGLRFVGFDLCGSKASDHRCVVAEVQRRAP